MTTAHARTIFLFTGAALVCGMGLAGCRGDRSNEPPRQFFPDMDDQPRFNPQSETQFFSDGRTMRQPVEGTVPFGYTAALVNADWNQHALRQRDTLLKDDDRLFLGKNADSTYLDRIPVEVTPALLTRGAERFGIFCATCHGYGAEGATPTSGGLAGRKWSAPVPGLHAEQYLPGGEKGQDGYLFTVIRNGVWGPDGANRMPGYAHAINENDAWAVVAHLRVLQQTRMGTIDELPETQRLQLEAQRITAPASPASTDQPADQPATDPQTGVDGSATQPSNATNPGNNE
jgi:mono/diheme cytochrome c family protein